MEFLLFWIVFAVIIGVAANTRGRPGFIWFLLAVVISPVLAGLLLLALPRLQAGTNIPVERPFEPEGVIAGVPYRLGQGDTVDAILQGKLIHFANMGQFRAAAEGGDAALVKSIFPERVDGIPFAINANSTITAETPLGVRTYQSWAAFRYATKKKNWRYGSSG